MEATISYGVRGMPWHKGKLTGQKLPPKLTEICAVRIRLQLGNTSTWLAMSNLAIDSKLRVFVPTRLRVRDICVGSH